MDICICICLAETTNFQHSSFRACTRHKATLACRHSRLRLVGVPTVAALCDGESRVTLASAPFPSTTMTGPTGLFGRPLFLSKVGSLSERRRSSYNRVVALERRLLNSSLEHRDFPSIRVLGWRRDIEHLARSIQSCPDSDDASLTQLGRFYAKYFVNTRELLLRDCLKLVRVLLSEK